MPKAAKEATKPAPKTAEKLNSDPAKDTPVERHQRIRIEGNRETVESIVVAIILALLFRAFVAEAFVIPTGSMAPALMGAHKDLNCPECGQPYQVGASFENPGLIQANTIVGSVCPNCRHHNSLDLANNPDDQTFNGDRILVSKFAYALSDPRRWDVIVFKYPGNPKQNYIKRLVGLPSEVLRIQHGDVFSKPDSAEDFTILRKPPEKLMAMSHTVHDTNYQAAALIAANYPSNWQPWEPSATTPPTDSWNIVQTGDDWSAKLEQATPEPKLLRYYHRWPSSEQWQQARAGLSLAGVDPYSSYGISDFYPYNAAINVQAENVYDVAPGVRPADTGILGNLYYNFFPPKGVFRPDYQSGGDLDQFRDSPNIGSRDTGEMGSHWVGDLIAETELQVDDPTGELVLELVESAVRFQCRINAETGLATLEIIDVEGPVSFANAGGTATENPTAETRFRAGSFYQVRFANCDDQLYLWINGSPVTFNQSPTYNMDMLRTNEEQRPFTQPEHPYDASPVAIGVANSTATISRVQILRDKYYIALDEQPPSGFNDYDMNNISFRSAWKGFQEEIKNPKNWDESPLWDARRTVEFRLDADQFFPMGDNSPESLDARCWVRSVRDPYTGMLRYPASPDKDAYLYADKNYVPRDLLVGKAVMVFWPHTWNRPVPFTPNFKRIGFIR